MTIQELLTIDLPVIQAPMAGVQNSALAAAVSNAGGLGSLPCAMLNSEALQTELQTLARLTEKPVNLNFFSHQAPQPDPAQNTRWLSRLAPYFTEFGVRAEDLPTGPQRQPFSHAVADIVEPFTPAVMSFHFGLPFDDLLERVKSWGCRIIASATTIDEALWLQSKGVDAIIAQGLEAGGHRGNFLTTQVSDQSPTLPLLMALLKTVDIPVIAAGGIADANAVSQAISLGASGVQVGTAYLLSNEATTSTLHREILTTPAAQQTTLTNVFSGHMARGIINRAIRELGPVSDEAPAFPLAANAMSALRAKAEEQGRHDFTPLWCGQGATGCQEIPAADITHQLATDL